MVVERTDTTVTVMNLYPYGSGHLLVPPCRHEAELEEPERRGSRRADGRHPARRCAIKDVYSPDGLNVGMNLGAAAGAGVPGHLHLHVLPRWHGDTNFMTTVAEVRVLPEDLGRPGWARETASRSGPADSAITSPPVPEEPEPEAGDTLPTDLDPTAYVGPYQFPDIRRRRIAATMYFVVAAGCAGRLRGQLERRSPGRGDRARPDRAVSPRGGVAVAVDQTESLAVASRTVGFPVGHASAQLAWRGLRSRPHGGSCSTARTSRRVCAAWSSSRGRRSRAR